MSAAYQTTERSFGDHGIILPVGASGEVYTTCPRCSSERKKKSAKCLSVNVDKNCWLCHHCGWAGGLNSRSEYLPSHWAKPTYRKPEPDLANRTELPDEAVKWFRSRGITQEVLIRNRIGYGSEYMPQAEGHENVIVFPYFRGEELINCKYRSGRKHFKQIPGCEQILWGLNDVADAETWIWCEGEMDKLSLEVAGYQNVVSVPNGAPNRNTKDYSSKFDFLMSDAGAIQNAKTHIIAVDADENGQVLESELIRRLGREKCRIVRWPRDCKDANDTLQMAGPGIVKHCIDNARELPVEGVLSATDVYADVLKLYEHGMEGGVATGFGFLDELFTVRPGEMTIVTGIPNSGKSNWVDALLVNLAKLHGWRSALFSPENQPIADHVSRCCEKYLEKPFRDGLSSRMDQDELQEAMNWVNDHFSFILPEDDSDWTLGYVLDAARQLVYRNGIRCLVIDPWNEMEHERPANQTETEYVGSALKKIRQFARTNGVHVFVVAHPAKLYKDKNGNYPVPSPYDISGSAHWRNKADNCITIWRDFSDRAGVVEIHIQKVRFRQVGKIGACRAFYQFKTGHYNGGALISENER